MTLTHLYATDDREHFAVGIDFPTHRVTVRGELDMASAPVLVDAVTALTGPAACDIAVDLRAVTFIDASSLGALVGLGARQRSRGTNLYVVGNAIVARLAAFCGLESLIGEQPALVQEGAAS
jgi:anti-anti-sigma factor